MSSKIRESPSVVSTRIIKTHRMNAVKAFQLQRRVQNIDHEIHQNYSQISDEIDGVRKNLVKIKNVKAGMGVSVARRKLLQELGFRVVPVSGSDSKTVILISPDGQRTCVNVADFYNGVKPSVLQRDNNLQPDNERTQERNPEIEKRKDFRFRIISPPLRSGSRRNFKNIEDENSDDERKLLFDPSAVVNTKTLKLVRPRAHTTCNPTKSSSRNSKEPASRRTFCRVKTCPSNIVTRDNSYTTPKWKESSGESSSSAEDSDDEEDISNLERKCFVIHEQELTTGSASNQKTTQEQVTQPHNTPTRSSVNKQFLSRKLSLGSLQRKHCVKFSNDVSDSGKRSKSPQLPSRKLSLDSRNLIGINLNSACPNTDCDKNHNKKISAWSHHATPTIIVGSSKDESCGVPDYGLHELTLNQVTGEVFGQAPELTVQAADIAAEFQPRVRSISQSSYFSSEHDQQRDHSLTQLSEERAVSSFRTQRKYSIQDRPNSVMSNSTVMSGRPRAASRRASTARSIDAASVDISIRDARTDKSVSQEFTTMQMTIGGRQVKVHVPKFSSDALDTVERPRTKTSARFRSNTVKHAQRARR